VRAQFNKINGFTLGDAVYVANIWADLEYFPWQPEFIPFAPGDQSEP